MQLASCGRPRESWKPNRSQTCRPIAVRLAAPAAASNAFARATASGLVSVAGIRSCSYMPKGWHKGNVNVKS